MGNGEWKERRDRSREVLRVESERCETGQPMVVQVQNPETPGTNRYLLPSVDRQSKFQDILCNQSRHTTATPLAGRPHRRINLVKGRGDGM